MRQGECDVTETWTLQHFLELGLGLGEEAVKLLRKIPEDSQSPHEAWLRGLMAFWGRGVEQDRERAAAILKPHELDPLCAALLGVVYYWTCDYSMAFGCWQRSADAGCCEGTFRLGYAYWHGVHVEEDEDHSFKLWCKATEMMHPDALLEVGDCYLRGQGVKQDVEPGLRYYAQAINLGNRHAIYELARAYRWGQGVARDLRCAASLFRQALLEGLTYVQLHFDHMTRNHPQAVVPYGEWRPDEFLHQWVPNEMHRQMRTVLLMHARRDSLFSRLPRVLLPRICFWICTDPI